MYRGQIPSPLKRILVIDVPLRRRSRLSAVSCPTNSLMVNDVARPGEYRYLNPQQLILSVRMDADYVGTRITLETDDETSDINLAKHRRFHIHYTPTSSSWLNLVEHWFRELTQKRLRCGNFTGVDQLVAAIKDYLAQNNNHLSLLLGPPPPNRSLKRSIVVKEFLRHYTSTSTSTSYRGV